MSILSESDIEKKLNSLSVEWSRVALTILERVFHFKNFEQSVEFVNKIADAANDMNHHPDLHVTYDKVVVHITTHSEQGLTVKDFTLAKKIEKIYEKQ